ncbi:MAG TPA: ankyrin repeat domain-containing protein [Bacteroidales bacterium]|nr:ankyrin repeat domain-containing protein [Bacteroidales bacterium]
MKYYIGLLSIISLILLTILQTALGQEPGEVHKAVTVGDINKVRELIEKDSALLELKDDNGNTPLNIACRGFKGDPVIIKYLINKGAKVNTKNDGGSTPLHGACWSCELDIIELLVTRGADVNARETYGGTPLRYALEPLEKAVFLIEHGADINATSEGKTILHYALSFGSSDDLSKVLIEKGAIINQRDRFGNTELHLAAMKGFTQVAELLVKHGAKINELNNDKHSPLYYAAKHGYRNTSETLIALGAEERTIGESNYGKAPQLSAKLRKSEAYLWYMEAGGYAIKTKDHFLILSQQINFNTSQEACLVNGQVNPDELTDQKIIVLTTYPWGSFLNSDEEKLIKQIPKTELIFYSGKPAEINKNIEGLPVHHLLGPNNTISFKEIRVHSTPRVPGVGFLLEVDGLKILDCKSFACNNEAARVTEYRKAIDSLKEFGPIDIVVLPVNGHMWVEYEPYLYLIDQLSPGAIYLTGGEGDPVEYPKCAGFLKTKTSNVQYPESKIAGDRFHFTKE